jgi:hypothetical protein
MRLTRLFVNIDAALDRVPLWVLVLLVFGVLLINAKEVDRDA